MPWKPPILNIPGLASTAMNYVEYSTS